MIEQKMRSALPLLAGLLLSAGAWGQTVLLVQNNDYEVYVAQEYFGSSGSREVVFSSASQAAIRIDIADAPATGDGVLGAQSTAKITFTLNGATFAASATSNNLKYFAGDPAAEASNIVRSVDRGGARGDRTVTYELEVSADVATAATGDEFLIFSLPSLDVTPVVLDPATQPPSARQRGVTVVAAIEPGRSGANPFPSSIVGASGAVAEGTETRIVAPFADGSVVRLSPALTAGLGVGGEANVAINNLKAIASGGGSVDVTLQGDAKAKGLKVGELSVTLTDSSSTSTPLRVLRTAALTNVGGTLNSSLGGTAVVSVSGDFQQGDRVLLGRDQTADTAKAFEMSGGVATVEVPFEGGVTGMDVVYVPGGVEDLTPGTFSAALSLDFTDDRNAGGPAGRPSSGTIVYDGISTQAYAYGVVRSGGLESSFLRVGCVGAPPATGVCAVYMTCYDQAGQSYFGSLDPIANNATTVVNSVGIARALGGGWSNGRGRCDLMSNGSLEVQHMVRSGGIQVNNSVVIGADGILDKD